MASARGRSGRLARPGHRHDGVRDARRRPRRRPGRRHAPGRTPRRRARRHPLLVRPRRRLRRRLDARASASSSAASSRWRPRRGRAPGRPAPRRLHARPRHPVHPPRASSSTGRRRSCARSCGTAAAVSFVGGILVAVIGVMHGHGLALLVLPPGPRDLIARVTLPHPEQPRAPPRRRRPVHRPPAGDRRRRRRDRRRRPPRRDAPPRRASTERGPRRPPRDPVPRRLGRRGPPRRRPGPRAGDRRARRRPGPAPRPRRQPGAPRRPARSSRLDQLLGQLVPALPGRDAHDPRPGRGLCAAGPRGDRDQRPGGDRGRCPGLRREVRPRLHGRRRPRRRRLPALPGLRPPDALLHRRGRGHPVHRARAGDARERGVEPRAAWGWTRRPPRRRRRSDRHSARVERARRPRRSAPR